MRLQVSHRGLEDDQAVGFAGAAGEEGVVLGMDDAFRVGHEAQDAAGDVADAGDGFLAAVGEGGELGGAVAVFVGILKDDLVVGAEGFHDGGVAGDEAAFAVGDGEIEQAGFFGEPGTLLGDGADFDPAVFTAAL